MSSETLLAAGITLPDMPRIKERSTFGERLFQARTHAQLSQQVLADMVDVSQNNISHLEIYGQGSPKVEELARACGVSVAWLSRGVGPMVEGDQVDTAVAETIAKYAPAAGADYQTVVHSLADALTESGTEVPIAVFVKMADQMYRKFSRR